VETSAYLSVKLYKHSIETIESSLQNYQGSSAGYKATPAWGNDVMVTILGSIEPKLS